MWTLRARAPEVNFGVCPNCGEKNEPQTGAIECSHCGAYFESGGAFLKRKPPSPDTFQKLILLGALVFLILALAFWVPFT